MSKVLQPGFASNLYGFREEATVFALNEWVAGKQQGQKLALLGKSRKTSQRR